MIRQGATSALLLAAVVLSGACGHSGNDAPNQGSSPDRSAPSPSRSASPPSLAVECPLWSEAKAAKAISFDAEDGARLNGFLMGAGQVGVVLANDVPHSVCEELVPAAWFARHGFRTVGFDYRSHGMSPPSAPAGRLDLDIAAAIRKLETLGAKRVVVVGAYGGVAAAVVEAALDSPAPSALIGLLPAPSRGQYIEGPFGPVGALTAARKMRVPALYVTERGNRYVTVGEARRLLQATGSKSKQLVTLSGGGAVVAWDLLDLPGQESARLRKVLLPFLARA